MILGLWLVACWPGLTPIAGDTATSGVHIDGVSPNHGPTAGGTAVTITGTGFDGTVHVFFGKAEVPSTRVDAGTLLVTSPATGVEATVDVEVTSDSGQDTLVDGFHFTDAGGGDSGETGDTGEVHGTGKVGGLVEMSLVQIACPDCFGASSSLSVTADAAFHAPADGSWTGWLPSSGSCVKDPTKTSPASKFVDVGEWVYLESGSASIGLRKTSGSSGPTYLDQGLDETDFVRNAAWDVSVSDGGAWGPFEVKDAATTPQGFDSISPTELLYTRPQDAFTARISKTNATFGWAPSGGTGSFVVVVDVYSADGSSYLGEVVCRGADSGSMKVPSAQLQGYPNNALLAVGLYRYGLGDAVIPANGATLESVATVGVLGTGVLVP